MDFKQLASDRYSCRRLSDRKVDESTVRHLLEVQRLAPTAANRQPQRIYVLEGEDAVKTIAKATHYDFGARLFFVVCYDKDESWKRKFDGFDGGIMDAVIIGCHLDLAVAAAGLGTCWIAHFDPDALRDAMDLPDNHIPVAIFPIGYPAEDARPSRAHTDRRPLDDTVIDRR
ncbi:MAG: nitroreductase [Clostridiaceae bacterium]|jgi:nitroreductase|nr:nitroreductase [Clostridiaceae bacterium]